MYELLLWAAAAVAVAGLLYALDGSRDVFHPLVLIAPMLGFLYAWMPSRLLAADGLDRFFNPDQLLFVQRINVLGVLAFVIACLSVGARVSRPAPPLALPPEAAHRLTMGAYLVGAIGLGCWLITIVNVGGFVHAFSASYSGGWDDSGYVRDGSLLMLVGVLLAVTSLGAGGARLLNLGAIALYGLPWSAQALLMARRGPTFAIIVIVAMGWYLPRRRRPPILATAGLGLLLGYGVLFLVTNRSSIYLGSNFDVKTDVTDIVETPDTGNEYIYGAGSILSAVERDHYFWMRRYLAQILVRPIPSAIWPTKYADFGVPELLTNAGTGEGFADALGWVGAAGSAPGVVADLWVELWWLAIPAIAFLGWAYGSLWRRAVTRGGPWTSQYAIFAALSIYLVMQTMEAVIFRSLLLSIPSWLVWRWAERATPALPARRRVHAEEEEVLHA